MNPSKSESTRLLCASAFLVRGFDEQVLKYLESPDRAVCPELGLDLKLVANVCQYVKDRKKRTQLLLFGVAVAAAIGAWIDLLLGAAFLLVGGVAVYFGRVYGEQAKLVRSFTKDEFSGLDLEKRFSTKLAPESEGALPREDQNLFVYRGFMPFLGAGIELGGWSFTVDLSKPAEHPMHTGRPQSFRVEDIYEALTSAITASGLAGLQMRDAYFVSGSEIRGDREILPGEYSRPVQYLDLQRAKDLINKNDSGIRYYKWIQIQSWGQELVTSYFIRCSQWGSNMFVEISRFVLTPIAEQYRGIDALPPLRARQITGLFLASLFVGPLYAAVTPLLMLRRIQEKLQDLFDKEEKIRRQNIDDNPKYNYGTTVGMRETFGSSHFMHYFQKTDGDFYIKVLERTLLSSVISFLDEHQIDTSDLRERQTMILNSGIIVHGGDVNAESLAVGAGAQAIKSTRPQPKGRVEGKKAA
jgi:hypothetical protein